MRVGILGLQGSFAEHYEILLQAAASINLNLEVTIVRKYRDLIGCSGIIIPGGESSVMLELLNRDVSFLVNDDQLNKIFTTSQKLIILINFHPKKDTEDHGFYAELENWVRSDRPTLGTCAGLIILSKMGLDICVERNFYGPQKYSFVADIFVDLISESYQNNKTPERDMFNIDNDMKNFDLGNEKCDSGEKLTAICKGIFIRAPLITASYGRSKSMCKLTSIDGVETVVGVRQGNIIGLSFHPELISGELYFHRLFLFDCLNQES